LFSHDDSIVIDEIDAVFRKRSSSEDSGEATRSSAVNQILAKLDGVNAIPNVLLIGMTNRRELLDEALLRPGRLEVQINVPLPTKEGRREILKIHFGALRTNGRLSRPLCCAIDGVRSDYHNNNENLMSIPPYTSDGATSSFHPQKRNLLWDRVVKTRNWLHRIRLRPAYDLAADSATGGFSGADIAGVVRCAGSIALARSREDGSGVKGLIITLDDVKQALLEVRT
jgi:SpoVK/Ycf46/Vps4 family AAA+-type ATPase